jgi:hypothetical protein
MNCGKGPKEDQALGIAERDREALEEKAAAGQAKRRSGFRVTRRHKQLAAEPDQIGRAGKAKPDEPRSHRRDQRSKAQEHYADG